MGLVGWEMCIRDRYISKVHDNLIVTNRIAGDAYTCDSVNVDKLLCCLLYTSDAADEN